MFNDFVSFLLIFSDFVSCLLILHLFLRCSMICLGFSTIFVDFIDVGIIPPKLRVVPPKLSGCLLGRCVLRRDAFASWRSIGMSFINRPLRHLRGRFSQVRGVPQSPKTEILNSRNPEMSNPRNGIPRPRTLQNSLGILLGPL